MACGRVLQIQPALGLAESRHPQPEHSLRPHDHGADSTSPPASIAPKARTPFDAWDAAHQAKDLLGGWEGDVRVEKETIIVTYYNAPNAKQLRQHYENLPAKLTAQKVNPKIPWLYDFKLDFRFK